jgi:hypothetical protein
VARDRVLNFRFADAPVADTAWCRKYHGVVLASTPGLARLNVQFDERTRRLKIHLENKILVDDSMDETGRQRVVDAITGYVLSLEENPLKGNPSTCRSNWWGTARRRAIRTTKPGRLHCIAARVWRPLAWRSVMQISTSGASAITS